MSSAAIPIEVTSGEARQLVCNALVVGSHYIQPKGGSERLRPSLEDRGYHVHEFNMSEFMKAGGAIKCLVLKLAETQGKMAVYR